MGAAGNFPEKELSDPDFILEIFLQPGEFYWGDGDTRIRTILGSCVSICIHHKTESIGGTCHYLLPNRSGPWPGEPDGRYADEAMELFRKEIKKTGKPYGEFVAKVFGGSTLFKHVVSKTERTSIGERNIQAAQDHLRQLGIKVIAQDVGGPQHRKILFDLWSGHAWVRKQGSTYE